MSYHTETKLLLLVSTPFQYLSAIECVEQLFPGAQTLVVVAADTNALSAVQLTKLFKRFPPTERIDVTLQHYGDIRERIASYSSVLPQLSSKRFDAILVGDLRQNWMQDIACSVDASEHILLDDGAATLSIYDYLLKPTGCTLPIKLFHSSEQRQLEVTQIKLQLGFSIRPKTLKVFSVFDLEDATSRTNRFSLLKRELGCPSKRGRYWHFIGSPIVEKNLASREEYEAVLFDALATQSQHGQAFYIAHRAEDMSGKATRLAEMGFTVISSEQPYELFLLQQPDYPTSVSSFHSTCLFNLAVIFGNDITKICYQLSEPALQQLKQHFIMQNQYSVFQHIDSIYQRLAAFNIVARTLTLQESA